MLEEQKLSAEAGDFVHTIANRLADKKIQIEGVSDYRAKLIMELSVALRKSDLRDRDARTLYSEGVNLSEYPRSEWISLAGYLIDSPKETPLTEIIEQLTPLTNEIKTERPRIMSVSMVGAFSQAILSYFKALGSMSLVFLLWYCFYFMTSTPRERLSLITVGDLIEFAAQNASTILESGLLTALVIVVLQLGANLPSTKPNVIREGR
ncbi:hypothetical protein [Vibrio cyclitrophicus]|uniref:Uncharacterized protein n=2 Tax=Vibrio cyclitrophicus TaxID=47951 RepID=A0A7Z1MK80_9VIBR|nr:hypothetical protein [Vibrio cyclitrophicus]PMP21146.1 hypothetical protein BCS91_20670 [Vibrio cyclitrophicus]PMP30545.1 hypothetical protein BCS90_14690 [Vibrio cyclitrophicus]